MAPESDKEDGRLKAIELYNMQLNAQMAVLSACNTGVGRWQKGEGILCLGHAFTYAGVPSIIMSQWKVPDWTTQEIMTHFYEQLKLGLPKDEALTKAKRAFLKTHPELSHPYFWAGFIALGDMAPINLDSHSFWVGADSFWLFMLLPIIMIIFFYKRRKK